MNVSLFIPCLTDLFFPQSGMNMVKVLKRLGVNVSYKQEQTCCGQPAFNSGYHHEAKALAQRFLDILSDAEYIVAPSGSCTSMVKIFYNDLLQLDDRYREKAEHVKSRLYEFTSFLVDVMRVEDVGATYPVRVTFHDACHGLHELHMKSQPRKLLAHVRNLEFVEMEQSELCCGFGGTFAVKHANISSAMAEEKIDQIMKLNIEYVVSIDSSCLMQIEGMLRRKGSRIRTTHIADILAGV